MSKAQRTKGNVKPAKSDTVADLVGSSRTFIGFDTQNSFNVEPEVHAHLKKLQKKDPNTKIKSLQDLSEIFPSQSDDSVINILPRWSGFYPKLCIEDDNLVRKNTQVFHSLIVTRSKKAFAPYLKAVLPYWLLSMQDPYPSAAKEAKSSFYTVFPDDKWKNVIVFAKEELCSLLMENFELSPGTYCDESGDNLVKFHRILSQTLSTVIFICPAIPVDDEYFKENLYKRIASSSNLTKLIDSEDLSVQKAAMTLLSVMHDRYSDLFNDNTVIISLKPLENFAFKETDDKLLKVSWDLIEKLESFSKFARATKHSKQFTDRILSSCISMNSHLLQFVSEYLFTTRLNTSLQSLFFKSLVELVFTSLEENLKLSSLNEILKSLFLWKISEFRTDFIDVITRLCSSAVEDVNSVLYRTVFFQQLMLVAQSGTDSQWLSDFVESVFSKALSGEKNAFNFLLSLFTFTEKSHKGVSFQTDDSVEISENPFDELYFSHVEELLSLPEKPVIAVRLILLILKKTQREDSFDSALKLYKDVKTVSDESIKNLYASFVVSTSFSSSQVDSLLSEFDDEMLEPVFLQELSKESDQQFIKSSVFTDRILDLVEAKIVSSNILSKLLQNSDLFSVEFTKNVVNKILQQLNRDAFATFEVLEYSLCCPKCKLEVKLQIWEKFIEFIDMDEVITIVITSLSVVLRDKYTTVADALKIFEVVGGLVIKLDESKASEFLSVFEMFFENDSVQDAIMLLLWKEAEKLHVLSRAFIECRLVIEGFIQPFAQPLDISWEKLNDINFVKYIIFISRVCYFLDSYKVLESGSGFRVIILHIASCYVLLKEIDWLSSFDRAKLSKAVTFTSSQVDRLNQYFSNHPAFSENCGYMHPTRCLKLKCAEDVLLETAVNGDSDQYFAQLLKLRFELCSTTENSEMLYRESSRKFFELFSQITARDDLLCSSCEFEARSWINIYLNRESINYINTVLTQGSSFVFSSENWDSILCAFVCWTKSVEKTQNFMNSPAIVSFCVSILSLYTNIHNFMASTTSEQGLNSLKEWVDVFEPEIIPGVVKIIFIFIKFPYPEVCFSTEVVLNAISILYCDKFVENMDYLCDDDSFISIACPSMASHNYSTQIISATCIEKYVRKSNDNDTNLKYLLAFPEVTGISHQLCEQLMDKDVTEQCTVEDFDSQTVVSAYFLNWAATSVILNKFTYSQLEEKLEEIPDFWGNFTSLLCLCFKVLPERSSKVSAEDFERKRLARTKSSVGDLAFLTLVQLLVNTPKLVRDWWEKLDRRGTEFVDGITSKHITPFVVSRQMALVNADKQSVTDERLTIKALPQINLVQAKFAIEDFELDVKLSFAQNYPLGKISIEEIKKKKIGVKEEEWQRLLLDLKIALERESGSIVQAVQGWRNTLDKLFQGVEECCVCMAILHPSNRSLPTKPCKVCKKKFHAICLFTWFEKGTANCPYCRSVF